MKILSKLFFMILQIKLGAYTYKTKKKHLYLNSASQLKKIEKIISDLEKKQPQKIAVVFKTPRS